MKYKNVQTILNALGFEQKENKDTIYAYFEKETKALIYKIYINTDNTVVDFRVKLTTIFEDLSYSDDLSVITKALENLKNIQDLINNFKE